MQWLAHGLGYMGLAATTWVPNSAQLLILSLNDHLNPPQGRKKGFGKIEFGKIFRRQ